MRTNENGRRWIAAFLAGVLILLAALSAVVYVVDPYFQFRVRDHAYFLTPGYVNAGLIKNFDYDTLIMGSCMIGNYDMDQFRREWGAAPLKAEGGGMRPSEMAAYLNLAEKTGKANRYYINIDLPYFTEQSGSVKDEYLMRNDFLSRCKYFLGYETWFRFVPVDVGLLVLKSWKGEFSQGKFSQRTSIDENGSWPLEKEFGEEIVRESRFESQNVLFDILGDGTADNLYERMRARIDDFILKIDLQNREYSFVFPPYPALFWCDVQDLGCLEGYLAAKQYFIQRLSGYESCTIYDFQSADITMDLSHYCDSNHYDPTVNDWMVECFANHMYVVTEDNYMELQGKLIENMILFREMHSDLFE